MGLILAAFAGATVNRLGFPALFPLVGALVVALGTVAAHRLKRGA